VKLQVFRSGEKRLSHSRSLTGTGHGEERQVSFSSAIFSHGSNTDENTTNSNRMLMDGKSALPGNRGLPIFRHTGTLEIVVRIDRFPTAKRLNNKAQGQPRSGATLGCLTKATSTPRALHRMLCNAVGVKESWIIANPGCAARVWALLCNAFGVKSKPWQDF
jgi:hypothetical protein